MTEEESENEHAPKKSMTAGEKSKQEISVPMCASAEDILRASRIVMDKGGSVRFVEISKMFGEKKSEQNLLGYALNAASAFGILEPHKGKAPYKLSGFGKNLLTAQEEQQRGMLLPRFLEFAGYRDILIGMRNKEDRTIKKQTVTDMWINIIGGTVGTRKLYTRTFASVGEWCGAIEISGQSCVLKRDVESLFSQILTGEGRKVEITPALPSSVTLPLDKQVSQMSPEISRCPVCNKADLIVNERYLDKIPTKGGTLLLLERTIKCRSCSNKFVRTVKELIPSPE